VFIGVHPWLKLRLKKITTMVNSQQGRALEAYKKKHSLFSEKFFFQQNLHDFVETLSTDSGWHRRCLNAAERGKCDFLSSNPTNI